MEKLYLVKLGKLYVTNTSSDSVTLKENAEKAKVFADELEAETLADILGAQLITFCFGGSEMFKEIGAIMGLLSVPHNNVLKLDKVANINGDELTLTITSEECAELIQSITKVKRYGFHDKYEENLHEEVADVLICIAELVCLGYLDIDKVRDYQKLKINREIERAIQKEEELRKETEKHGTCE